jgi:hypothetical protein
MGKTTRPYVTLLVDGEETRPQDAYWVVFDPEGNPTKAFTSSTTTLDNRLRAMRSAFFGDTNALQAALDGYTIEIMSFRRFLKDVAPHIPDTDK